MTKSKELLLAMLFLALAITACSKLLPPKVADNQTLDGPIEGLSGEQHSQFLAGDAAFNAEVFTSQTGLGPTFVATSCASCHAGDGKGHPFTTLTRFGQSDTILGNLFLGLGGPQLQNRALPGFKPESIPQGATFSQFTPPANTGLGFVDAVSDAVLLALADPDDLNGDGISGRPNWIRLRPYSTPRPGSISVNGRYIGRFGKKASTYDLLQQTATAYNQDMGIVSFFEPVDPYSGLESDAEVSNNTVHNVVFYLKTLKAPVRRNENNTEVLQGQQLFKQLNCSGCHVQSLITGYSPVAALSNKTFFPYSDFLLHDMGAELNDGYTEGTALPAEWKTPPLWGLGLSKQSQGGKYYLMHDGRATSIEMAILLHGGEALNSKNQYQQLSSTDKLKLIRFLESL